MLLAAAHRTGDLGLAAPKKWEQLKDFLQGVGALIPDPLAIRSHFEIFQYRRVGEELAAFRYMGDAQIHDSVGLELVDAPAQKLDLAEDAERRLR